MTSSDTMSSQQGTTGRPAWVMPGAMGLAATGVLFARRRRAKAAKSPKGIARRVRSAIKR